MRNLLMKPVNWNRCLELNQFLGGFLGLAKATVFVWLILALSLTIAPQSVCVIEKSKASVRILALGESITGQAMSRGKGIVGLEDSFEDLSGTVGQHLGTVRRYADALALLKPRTRTGYRTERTAIRHYTDALTLLKHRQDNGPIRLRLAEQICNPLAFAAAGFIILAARFPLLRGSFAPN